jgi:hypothetical protein
MGQGESTRTRAPHRVVQHVVQVREVAAADPVAREHLEHRCGVARVRGAHSLPGGVRLVTCATRTLLMGCTHSRVVSDWLRGPHRLPSTGVLTDGLSRRERLVTPSHSRVSDWLHGPRTGCHQLNVFCLQKNVESAVPALYSHSLRKFSLVTGWESAFTSNTTLPTSRVGSSLPGVRLITWTPGCQIGCTGQGGCTHCRLSWTTGCHQLVFFTTIRAPRVAATPGGGQSGYVDHTVINWRCFVVFGGVFGGVTVVLANIVVKKCKKKVPTLPR